MWKEILHDLRWGTAYLILELFLIVAPNDKLKHEFLVCINPWIEK